VKREASDRSPLPARSDSPLFTLHPSRFTRESATIVALSSPAGRSARAIVRLSGPAATGIAGRIFRERSGRSLADLPGFRCADGEVLEGRLPCRLYLMRAPRSYTREDVVELHVPGNPLVAELVLEAALELGARLAEPGEFTRRALENGRISADQAEAVISLIRARSRAELAAAADQLAGRRGRDVAAWRERAADLLAAMEAEVDYGEEPGAYLGDAEAAERLSALSGEFEALAGAEAEESGEADDAGLARVALAGPANAGKSLLFRRLTGRDALVHDEAGTTRDVIAAPLLAAPGDAEMLDTAGLGAAPGEVEVLARAAAERAWRGADLLVLVLDASEPPDAEKVAPALAAARAAEIPLFPVVNKCDLPRVLSDGEVHRLLGDLNPAGRAQVSALTGEGCEALGRDLAELVRGGGVGRSPARLASGARRREVLRGARECLRRAADALDSGLGLTCAADDLHRAERLVALHFEPGAGRAELDEDVLNRIFARFCVGK
jgi:tRNA modification GTPase